MEPLTWTALIIVAILFLKLWKYRNASKKLPPCPRAIPLFGHVNILLRGQDKVFQLMNFFGETFHMRLLHMTFIFINTFDEIKEAFVTKVDAFGDKVGASDKFIQKLNQTSFHMISGPVWKEKRHFTIQHLRNFGLGKSEMEGTIMAELNRLCIELDKHVGKKLEINHKFFLPFLNILWSIIAGATYDYDNEKILQLSHALHEVFANGTKIIPVCLTPMLKYLPGDPFSYWKFVENTKIELNFIEKVIDEHLKVLKNTNEPRDYIEAYLLEIKKHEGTQLTSETECYQRDHLVGGIVDLLQGGTHTVTTAMRFSLLYMAVWPEIQTKVQQELDNVIGRNRLPEYSDHIKLPYARATMLEIFRYSTVARSAVFRIADRAIAIGNYVVPKGALAMMNFVPVHHDKKYWGDPDVFRPERFIDENGKYEPSDHVIPFGIGPRVCLGESLARMELFLIFVSLLQRYSFHCVTGEPSPCLTPLNETARHPRPFELVLKLRK